MAHSLPPLPYPADALEVAIDKMTMEIHHGKHHKAYVDNLNAALSGNASLEAKPIEQLLREIQSVPEAIRQELTHRGHVITPIAGFSTTMGNGEAVMRDAKRGVNFGASDPRTDGAAIPEQPAVPVPGQR